MDVRYSCTCTCVCSWHTNSTFFCFEDPLLVEHHIVVTVLSVVVSSSEADKNESTKEDCGPIRLDSATISSEKPPPIVVLLLLVTFGCLGALESFLLAPNGCD